MAHFHALPFFLKRSSDSMTASSFSTTQETAHGLIRLDGESLVVQWRVARKTDHVGLSEMKTDEEFESVREVVVPLDSVAGAVVRRRWWEFFRAPRLVLRAADLQAFEGLTGEDGLRLAHPAEIILPVRRADRLTAEEFAAELELAVAQRSVGPGGPAHGVDAGGTSRQKRLPEES